jgi:hypothetical protein
MNLLPMPFAMIGIMESSRRRTGSAHVCAIDNLDFYD